MTHEEQTKILADLKKAAEEKKAKERAYARKYYAEHREQCIAAQKRSIAKKPEYYKRKQAEYYRGYYIRNMERCKEHYKHFAERNPDYQKEYYHRNKQKWHKYR